MPLSSLDIAAGLDEQLAAGLRGDLERGWQLAEELYAADPTDPRVCFNRGWYLQSRGRLLEGQQLLDQGRHIRVFGDPHPGIPAPIWDGSTPSRLLLALEGGLGDQIHGMRYIREMRPAVVSCSRALFPVARKLGVQCVTAEASAGVDVDAWVPSMSAPTVLRLEYADVDATPYLPRLAAPVSGRVGVRWQGNPMFQHDRYRRFPPEPLFDILRQFRDVVALQRDAGAELTPDYMTRVDLSSWESTAEEVSRCEVVVTSCTSVAHLAAAMGVKTFVIVPVLPYYIWALPGSSTPWYSSVRLFRQTTPGDWTAPMAEVEDALWTTLTLTKAA